MLRWRSGVGLGRRIRTVDSRVIQTKMNKDNKDNLTEKRMHWGSCGTILNEKGKSVGWWNKSPDGGIVFFAGGNAGE